MGEEGFVRIYDEYIAEFSRYAFQAFSPKRLAADVLDEDVDLEAEGPASRQKPRFRGVIRNEITSFKTAYQDQFRVLAEAVVADESVTARLDDYLDHDPFYAAVDDGHRDAMRDATAEDMAAIAEALAPFVAADGVWDAVGTMPSGEAIGRLRRWFDRPDYLLDHVDHLQLTIDVSAVTFLPMDEIDYSREALRLLDEGRDYVERVIEADVTAEHADEERMSGI